MTDTETIAFLRIMDFFLERHILKSKADPEILPSSVYAKHAQVSLSKAQKGLLVGLTDMLEMARKLPDDAAREMDCKLREFGAPPLASLQLQYSKRLKKLLKTALVSSLEDYYLLKGALDGGFLDESAQVVAIRILSDFEDRHGHGGIASKRTRTEE